MQKGCTVTSQLNKRTDELTNGKKQGGRVWRDSERQREHLLCVRAVSGCFFPVPEGFQAGSQCNVTAKALPAPRSGALHHMFFKPWISFLRRLQNFPTITDTKAVQKKAGFVCCHCFGSLPASGASRSQVEQLVFFTLSFFFFP